MRTKRPITIPIKLPARLTRTGLLLSALGVVAGCQVEANATAAEDLTIRVAQPATQAFVRRPLQRVLFTAKPTAPAAEIEAYFKTNLLPALAADKRIGNVAVYVDGTGSYFVQAELRTLSPASASLAFEVLGAGRKPEEAEALLAGFAKYFDIANTRQLTPRADLSVSRQLLGTVASQEPSRPGLGGISKDTVIRQRLGAVTGGAQ